MEPTVSPPMRGRIRRVEKEQAVVRQQFCRKCGQPGDVSAEIRIRKRGRAGRISGGLIKTKNCILCDYCAAALLGWPTT